MKVGEIWQRVLGMYHLFNDLGSGTHSSGLDVISYERKIIIELKNRTNTDNASAKKTNRDKLAAFKKENPEYLCVYGCINGSTSALTTNTRIKCVQHSGESIYEYTGMHLLRLVFGDNAPQIVQIVVDFIEQWDCKVHPLKRK